VYRLASARASANTHAPHRRLPDRLNRLTSRERDVAALVARGLTDKTIAHELHISSHTVRTNLKRIFSKFGVDSRRR
jgi:DNA-binding NarL/FixJ family response regulator